MERRHSTTSDSSDSSHTRQSSGDNVETTSVGRVSKLTGPKPLVDPLQFVKTGPCDLFRSAQEQLKRVEELKKTKKQIRDEAEEWQSNLDNWKCSRRKRQEHIIERVVEVKKMELEEHERNRRRSKTFNEMMQDRNIRGRKSSLPVYQDDSNDLSDLGIGNGDNSLSQDSCGTSTDSDHERGISLDQTPGKRFEKASVQNGENDTEVKEDGTSDPADVEEYTYERAIQGYVNFAENRVNKSRTARSSTVVTKNLPNGQAKGCPPVPIKPRRSSTPRIGNSVSQIEQRKFSISSMELSESAKKQPDVPKVDISKRKELFEKSTEQDESSKKLNRSCSTELSSAKSIKERLSSLKEQTGSGKVPCVNKLPTDYSVKDRLSDIEKMKANDDQNQPKRKSSEQLTTKSIKERLSSLEKVKNSSQKTQQNPVEPTITLKERLSSLQSACSKESTNAEPHSNEKLNIHEREVEECYRINQSDKYERAFSPDGLYSNKTQQHYRHRSLDSLDIDNDGASNDTFERVQSLEDLDYCRNYPASSLSGDTDREDSGIHTADVSSCVSQADDYDLHMDTNSDDIKLHHQPTIVEENKVGQYENPFNAQDTSCVYPYGDSNDGHSVSPQAFGSSLDSAEENGVLDEFANSNVSLKNDALLAQPLPIILESPEAFPNPLKMVDGVLDSKRCTLTDDVSCQNTSLDEAHTRQDNEVGSDGASSVCILEKSSSNPASNQTLLLEDSTNISDCSSMVNVSHVEINEQIIEDIESGYKCKTDSANSVISKKPVDDPSTYNYQKLENCQENKARILGDKDDGIVAEGARNIYSAKESELINIEQNDLNGCQALNETITHIDTFKTQNDVTNVQLLTTQDPFMNIASETRDKISTNGFFMPTESMQGGLFLNLSMDQEVESVFQLSPAALEPPKEKPPPPPTDFSDDELDETSNKPSSLRRLDSTKRIKKEIRQKRSSFLGIEGTLDDSYLDPELELIRPPDMTTLLVEERRMERQLYRQSVCSESDSNQESRDSGVELDNKNQDIACWNHSRNDSEVYCNQSTTSEEDEIMRKEREIIETLEQEERIRKQDLGEKLALRLRQLEVEKGRGDWERVPHEEDFRTSAKLSEESNHIQDIDEFQINQNEPNQIESLNSKCKSMDQDPTVVKQDSSELYNHEESIMGREPIEISQFEDNTQLAWYDTRSSLQDVCYKTLPENPLQHPLNNDYGLEFGRNSMQDLTRSSACLQNGRQPVSHGRSMPNLQEVASPQRRPPPPPPPLLPSKPRLQPNGDITSCPQQMTRQTLHALSAAPRSRLISNDTWQAKRKPRQENYNYQHWLIQEAEHRRITEHQQRQQNVLPVVPPQRMSPSKQGGWGHQPIVNQPHYPIPPHPHHQWSLQTQQRDSKPLPDSVIQTITQRIQNRMNNSDTNNNNRRRYETHHSQNDHHQEKMLSVSGKKRCSHCGEELGRGAAMIIESLRLFYHIDCFKCCVCCMQLGDGMMGTDVRVRNNKLHCHNCYSSDDGVKFSCV